MMHAAENEWRPHLGAWPEHGGFRFRVWAPDAQRMDVVIGEPGVVSYPMTPDQGYFNATIDGLGPGALYRFAIDGDRIHPDPASRWQPQGVHGPSSVIDPGAFRWTDSTWKGLDLEGVSIYELHVGAFTPEGTFAAAESRLPYLRDLGITAIELMPVADFPGDRNWGYDGAALFAPARCYGSPEGLRRLIDRAHALELGVIMDVVYNHFGPSGAYAPAFSPYYFASDARSPWGAALNFDGPHREAVRDFFIQNALAWIHEYHIDGLRLDATHAIRDESERHFLAELASAVRASLSRTPRRALVIAEDHRNLARMIRSEQDGGWSLDMVWSDDFHHSVRRATAGDSDGYFQDFSGENTEIAAAITDGWCYTGQHSDYFGAPRGSKTHGTSPAQFVFFIQNHDQVGNRALGDRLHAAIDPAVHRMATALLLAAPETPLLFMGQEWASTSPFHYFTDHDPELGEKVSRGRREEFRRFKDFQSPDAVNRIPDPQAPETFLRSKLNWDELDRPDHRRTLELHRVLLRLRRIHPALRCREREFCRAAAVGERFLLIERGAPDGDGLLVVICLRGSGVIELDRLAVAAWTILLTTEEERFAADPQPPRIEGPTAEFVRPGAAFLERRR